MKPKVENKSIPGFNPDNKKNLLLFSDVFYSARFFRFAAANFISKQLLSLFAGFYLLVKH